VSGTSLSGEGKELRLRNNLIVALTLLAAAAHTTSVKAQAVEQVTLVEALERFSQNGLSLRIARAEARVNLENARQRAAWPNPAFVVNREDLDGDGSEYSETTIDLAQPIVWPWRWSARREASQAIAREAHARFRADSASAALEVVRTWASAWEKERILVVLEAATAVFRDADRAAERRYNDGDLSGFDLRRLRIERARYEANLAAAGVALRTARRRLVTLIAPDSPVTQITAADVRPAIPDRMAVDKALKQARANRARLVAASAAIDAAHAELVATRDARVPEPTLRAGYKEQSDGFDGLVVGLSIAIPLFDRRGAAVEAARARVDESVTRARLVGRLVDEEVRQAVERHVAFLERDELQRGRLLTEVDDLLEIASVSYDAGEISLLELLDAADAWRDALTLQAELHADLVESGYELWRAIGGPIDPDAEEGP
jgi:cobalt-zinc-cadmium efflux system outer membrane protein